MENIWSENKYINTLINCLLVLIGINFLHYGQLLLPIVCLIIFIDRKLVFKVNNPLTFVLLCLFGVSFYAFSYQLGFYSVMGFTLPMAYYIGSNVLNNNEDNVKKIIYLLMFSMATHLLLNTFYELIVHGVHGFFVSSTHYDMWVGDKVSSTLIALDIDLLLACLYYLLFHEKNRKITIVSLIILLITMFYLIIIGRRTQVLMLVISLIIGFIYEMFVLKSIDSKHRKLFIKSLLIFCLLFVIFMIIYSFNIFNIHSITDNMYIFEKLSRNIFSDERVNLLLNSMKLMPKYLFGGKNITNTLGLQIHNFWLDVYDYAGIVSFILICIYSVIFAINVLKLLMSKKISNSFKVLVLNIVVNIFIQLNVEPAMTGASIFVIISIMLGAFFEDMIIDK